MGIFGRIFGKKNVEPIIPNYPLLIARCEIDADKMDYCRGVIKTVWRPNKARYEKVSAVTGVPAWVIFCIHYKEASCNFNGALHNGDRVIGNGKKTFNVPKGRGPFNTWEETASDALLMKKNIFPLNWKDLSKSLEFCERYNGLGHRLHGELSPYIWAYTNNHDETGNYVSDGKYDPEARIKSAGIASLLIAMEFEGEVERTLDKLFLK